MPFLQERRGPQWLTLNTGHGRSNEPPVDAPAWAHYRDAALCGRCKSITTTAVLTSDPPANSGCPQATAHGTTSMSLGGKMGRGGTTDPGSETLTEARPNRGPSALGDASRP